MNRPLRALRPQEHTRDLVADMSDALVETGADLGCEQDCILRLIAQRFRAVDINALLHDAVAAGRPRRQGARRDAGGNGAGAMSRRAMRFDRRQNRESMAYSYARLIGRADAAQREGSRAAPPAPGEDDTPEPQNRVTTTASRHR